MRLISLVSLSLLLQACAQQPTSQQVKSADYGTKPSIAECSALVEEKVGSIMKDPSSLQWQHNDCVEGYWSSVPMLGLPIAYGYYQTGSVNGKNSYGAYTGFQQYQALIRNGVVIRYCIVDRNGLCSPRT